MKTTPIRLGALTAALMFTLAASADDATPPPAATLPPASTKTGLTYATDIKPIIDANCAKCHSGDRPKAHIKLDSLEGILAGSKRGKVVIPTDGANSLMVKAAAHLLEDKDGWMPPMPNKAGAKTLTPEEIGLVEAWINQGAK